MSKKASYSPKKASSKVGSAKKEPTAASRSGRAATPGAAIKTKTKLSAVQEAEVMFGSGGASYYFLPLLKKDSPTYEYDQIKPLLTYLGYNQLESSELLEANASTLSRWKNSAKPVDIGKLRSKIVLDIDEIIAKGVRIFGNEELFQEWLNTSNYALGDVKPVDLLKDVYSIELVEDAIDALSWGSYV